jgi:hypothetical protein
MGEGKGVRANIGTRRKISALLPGTLPNTQSAPWIRKASKALAYNMLVVAWPKLKELARQQVTRQETLF